MSISKKINELVALLQTGPVLPGGIRKASETCGQLNCKCKRVNDPQLHGPYNTLSFSLKEKSSSMSLSQPDALLAKAMTERFKKAKVLLNELGIAYVDAGRGGNISGLVVPELGQNKQQGKTHAEKKKSKEQSKKNEANRIRIKNLEDSLMRAQNKCDKLKKEKELLKEENKLLKKEATEISLLDENKKKLKKKRH